MSAADVYRFACMMGISGKEKRMLLQELGSEGEILGMAETEIWKLQLVPRRVKEALCKAVKDVDWERGYEAFQKSGVRLVRYDEDEYPSRLHALYDPPYALFVRGKLPPERGLSVAIVGARGCSSYGREVAEYAGKTLAAAGASVISGLATGIDSYAHKGALAAGRPTYAVLGCGVNVCYPKENSWLYREMERCGGLLSELPPDQTPRPYFFPERNRLISGLADCVVVVEARAKSGSLITADCALEQGHDVYAVPGRIDDPLSVGTNRLIAQGAAVFSSAEELLRNFGILREEEGAERETQKKQEKFSENGLEKNERLVYSVLDFSPKHLDQLVEESGLGFADTVQALDGLMRGGYAREAAKGCYARYER